MRECIIVCGMDEIDRQCTVSGENSKKGVDEDSMAVLFRKGGHDTPPVWVLQRREPGEFTPLLSACTRVRPRLPMSDGVGRDRPTSSLLIICARSRSVYLLQHRLTSRLAGSVAARIATLSGGWSPRQLPRWLAGQMSRRGS